MEPVKQLIQLVTPYHFRPTGQAGDSEESFLAYLGQTGNAEKAQEQLDEAIQVELSPLARIISNLTTEGREALFDILKMLPEGERPPKELEDLLRSLVGNTAPEDIPARIHSLKELFNRITRNQETAALHISLSIRDLAGLTEPAKKFFFEAVDDFLKLGSRDVGSLFTDRGGLSGREYQDFLKVLSNLLRRGVVGVEEVKVRDQKMKTFVDTRLGSSRLRQAEPYRKDRYPIR